MITNQFLVRNPRWVAEGVACYLETLRLDRKRGKVIVTAVAFINTYRTTIAVTRKLPEAAMPLELKKRLVQVLRAQRGADQPTA